MDCVSVIVASLLSSFQGGVDAVLGFLRNLGAEGVGNLLNIEKNADTLAQETRELKEIRDDLENKVRNLERQPGMRRTHRVSGWLERVEALQGEVRSLQDSLARRLTFFESCTFDSLNSAWVLGGKVVDLLRRIRQLRGQRGDVDSHLVDEAHPDPVVAVSSKSAWIVGGEETLSAIRGYLKTEEVGIIGIYGMGGVGKTTLLSEINNQFLTMQKTDFDVVIWVTVSREINVYKIQEDIGVRLGFSRRGAQIGCPLPENEDDRRDTLYRALNQKRFLLLLDDMWEKLELEKIGIPLPNIQNTEGKKIVFTTRSEEVCADMGVQQAKIKVDFLDCEESWKLFRSNVDPRVNIDSNPDIQSLAEIVVRKCGGLPLALISMGRAMSNATRAGEWRQAVEKLRECPDKIRGMKDVLSILKFSFDRLEDDVTRECLLYCALFPEDYNISIEHLVDYWFGEGFLDANSPDSGLLCEARDRGDCIIRKLKDACLLESGKAEHWSVKMHDVVREMVLWLTGEEFEGTKRIVVCGGEKGLAQLVEAKIWEDARRISMIQGGALQLPSLEFHCRSLSTILISHRFGRWGGPPVVQLVINQNFCKSMPGLRVLDLSGTHIQELPSAIGLLAELRHLNLSTTRIRQLPKEVGKLVKLRQFYLRSTLQLRVIPHEAILMLTRLQKLVLCDSAYRWDDEDSSGTKLSDVGCCLSQLEELSVDIHTLSCLQILTNSERLRKCTRDIVLLKVADLTSPHLSAGLNKLEWLRQLVIRECPMLEVWRVDYCNNQQLGRLEYLSLHGLEQLKEVVVETEVFNVIQRGGGRGRGGSAFLPSLFSSLLSLHISSCHQLKDLRWIGQLPQLELLFLLCCEGLEELLVDNGQSRGEADDDHGSSFPRLKDMYLTDLRALSSISNRPLLFPSLERLCVAGCPRLKRLPLGRHSCKKIRVIEAEQEWWDALEWGDYDADTQSSCIKLELAPSFYAIQEDEGSSENEGD